jgi:hypothetical protein
VPGHNKLVAHSLPQYLPGPSAIFSGPLLSIEYTPSLRAAGVHPNLVQFFCKISNLDGPSMSYLPLACPPVRTTGNGFWPNRSRSRFPVHSPSDISCYRTERFLHPHHHTGARVPCFQWADSPNTQLEFPRLMRRWFERTCLQPRRTEQLTTQRPQAKPSLVQSASNSTYPLALRLGRHFIQDPIDLHVVMHTTGLAVTRSGRFLRERGPSGCSTPTGSTITPNLLSARLPAEDSLHR